jgi:uncharacterized protein (DUF58 family)
MIGGKGDGVGAWLRGFGPGPRLAYLFGAAALLLVLAVCLPPALVTPCGLLGIIVAGIAVAAALIDGARLPSPGTLTVTRSHDTVMSHGAPHTVLVRAHNPGRTAAAIELEEVWPRDVSPARTHLTLQIPPGGDAEVSYVVTPHKRGALPIAATTVRRHGRWRLLFRQRPAMIPAGQVHVYPDIRGIARYELAARRHLVGQLGIRSMRRRGSGTEIEGLRDYTPDDEYRRIDWKATARRDRPVTRQLRDEQSQSVYLLVDAGRVGAIEMGGATRLDFAVNAALVLAHVAAARGDRVGLLVFDRQVRRHLAPGRASAAIVPQLARLLYDVTATPVEADYGRAFDFVATHHRRRSLVVLFSDVLSPVASESLTAHMATSARRHLPLCVAIDDPAVSAAGSFSARPLATAADVYHLAAAAELRRERAEALQAMSRRGVLVLDVPPQAATPTVISRYLELKARRLL